MNVETLFSNLSNETSMILKQFLDVDSIGVLILNSELEILSMNKYVRDIFEDDEVEVDKYLGHIFGCEYIEHNSIKDERKSQCENCITRNSTINTQRYKCVVENSHVNNKYVIHQKKQIKWLDLSIAPIYIHDETYLFLLLKDLTQYMHFKVEYEMNRLFDGEESMIKKDEFHEAVMNCMKTQYHNRGISYLTLLELPYIQMIQESFGLLWRNDYVTSFYQFISEQMDILDLYCKYSNNQIMVFFPCKSDEEYNEFIETIITYQYKLFQMKDNVLFKTIKFTMDTDRVKELVDSDHLYLEYFKAISQLERIEKDTIHEFCF